MSEGYPSSWKKVTLMVSPTGELHAIGGDRAPGDGDTEFYGLTLLQRKFTALTDEPTAEENLQLAAWSARQGISYAFHKLIKQRASRATLNK